MINDINQYEKVSEQKLISMLPDFIRSIFLTPDLPQKIF